MLEIIVIHIIVFSAYKDNSKVEFLVEEIFQKIRNILKNKNKLLLFFIRIILV